MPTMDRALQLAKSNRLQVHWTLEGKIASVYNIEKDTAYVVYFETKWICTCPHYVIAMDHPNMGVCKHIASVQAKCIREGIVPK